MSVTSLTAVTLVLKPFPAVAALDHVGTSISSYLDGSVMIPLDEACSIGSTRLLDRIWMNSDPDAEEGTSWSLCRYLRTDIHYHRFQFSKALRAGMGCGDLDVVQWVLEHFSGCTADEEVVEEAARCGRMEILQYLLEYGRCEREGGEKNVIFWGGDDMVNAIKEGHGDVARWLYDNTPDARRNLNNVMKFAVRQGDRSLIQWLLDVVYQADTLLPPPSMNDAAAGGHMEVLQWIYEQGYGGRSDHALQGAATNGRLGMVKWLVDNGITKGAREAVQGACDGGHLNVVQWLFKRGGVQYPHFAMDSAIHRGHLDIVKYLCIPGIAYEPSRMMIEAASYGHLHLVKWLLQKYDAGLFPAGDPSRSGRSNQRGRKKWGSYMHKLGSDVGSHDGSS
ncbi:hypothetical protein PHYPSEUDO_014674 [Phytophthora pseudosyringae]|uniref:Uncharacterized protein n=1 Tax=Phytophthora pseudosyringae TaxID=221518 RepID=A0A8T1W507_9STRA|nr:hypothetical protein PHYPSEUDO_014674 [Phytophthora pseudosyringae]